MNRPPLWTRALRKLRREAESIRHVRVDERLLRSVREDALLPRPELERVADRLAQAPAALSPRVEEWRRLDAAWPDRTVRQAAEILQDEVTFFGIRYTLNDPRAWHRDPLRPEPWPVRPHSRIRLDDPDRPGDLRMQWEVARFNHGILLGRAWLATGDPAYTEAFLRQVDAFERGNPPYQGIHWSVGMEVAIRSAAWIFSLELMKGAPALTKPWRERLTRALLLHGVFLESHLERHFLGFTTNHTLADYAGLAPIGRHFEDTEPGRRWLALAARGLEECLREQVLPSGAHAECSLPYQRFVLEASLTAALRLDPADAAPLRAPIASLADHLRGACLPSGLPYVGDGDESFFPPFGFLPFEERNPLDPEPVLQVASHWLDRPDLRGRVATEEAAFWLGVSPGRREGSSGASLVPSLHGFGGVRFTAGPLEGLLVARNQGEGWLPTHGHNDLLSLIIDCGEEPLLIDPGTGGYGRDRALRQLLRSTEAHSTLQVAGLEQSPIRARATFEGPPEVPGAIDRYTPNPLRLRAWHDGFGSGLRHTRCVSWRAGCFWIEDRLSRGPDSSEGSDPKTGATQSADPTTILRFHLAPGLTPELNTASPKRARGGPERYRPCCRVRLPGYEVLFLLLHPREEGWQIQPDAVFPRYGKRLESATLQATRRGPLPHRWLTVLLITPVA